MGRVLVSVSFFDKLCKDAWKLLQDHGDEIVFDKEKIDAFPAYKFSYLQKILPSIDACIVGLDDYQNPAVWEISKRLKGVCKFGVGVDNFNLKCAAEHGKYVANCPGCNSSSVAELTVGLMIDLLREVPNLDYALRIDKWPRFIGGDLENKTIGLFGFGNVARAVAKRLSGFNVDILAYDPHPDEKEAERLKVKLVSENELIVNSDIISIHAPATRENYHYFNRYTFLKMKTGSFLINVARGALVNLDDLAEALQNGKIRGAALDTVEGEGRGFIKTQEIVKCRNVIFTPHTGSETYESYRNTGIMAANNVIDMIDGKIPRNCVNEQYFIN